MGNKDIVFLQERRYYLERFLRKLSQYDFIINGEEFQVFARPQGLDVEGSLKRLVKMSTTQLYQRLSGALNINIEECSEQEKQTLTAQLLEFGVYMKKAAPFLKKMKDEMASYVTGKQAIFTSYGGVASTLTSYEE